MPSSPEVFPLGFPFRTFDPFLFCVHHDDRYPRGNDALGPVADLSGRNLGQDFTLRDGFRMYHGRSVPGFPRHPHRGFETVTLVRRGRIDHADSLGARARFGDGDVQWMTAGHGIEHSEMFPLLRSDTENPVELFQIWLNLPARSKHVKPHFKMLWADTLPQLRDVDDAGHPIAIDVVCGDLAGACPSPPPDSWAADPANAVAIATLRVSAEARLTLPPAGEGVNRTLYAFGGSTVTVEGGALPPQHGMRVAGNRPLVLQNGREPTELLLLQGRPIRERVVKYGPFVMNTEEEIRQAYQDYRRGSFGRWPWDRPDPVHGPGLDRFAIHADGTEDRPT